MTRPTAPYSPGFYVSAIDGSRKALVAGPFESHEEALDAVDATRSEWCELDGRAWFYAWGTARVRRTPATRRGGCAGENP